MKHMLFRSLALVLLALAALPHTARSAVTVESPGTIAYVRSPTSNGSEIRLIEPGGANDRLVLAVPESPTGSIPTLAWRPDAAELAFASDHEAARSLYEKDIYAARPDGSGLRRLTNGPLPGQLASYPRGTVTVDVIVGSSTPALVYVAGAEAPLTVLRSERLTFTNVADLGGVQGVVGIYGPKRWYGVGADVQPGRSVHAGTLALSGDGTPRRADRPVWSHDGQRVGFMVGSGCGEFRSLPVSPPANAQGEPTLAATSFLASLCQVEWGPTAGLSGELLYNETGYNTRGFYRKSAGDGAGKMVLEYDALHAAIDLKWLPDGSGFVASILEWREGRWASGNLYEYTFATEQLRQITSFEAELAGGFSISPDGQWIVFERAPDTEAATDLWLVRRDGSDMRLLVRNAARPAWSSRAPYVPPTFRTYLPALTR